MIKDTEGLQAMAEKSFEQIRRYLEAFLKPEHIINERYCEQNYWMMSEEARYKDKLRKQKESVFK